MFIFLIQIFHRSMRKKTKKITQAMLRCMTSRIQPAGNTGTDPASLGIKGVEV